MATTTQTQVTIGITMVLATDTANATVLIPIRSIIELGISSNFSDQTAKT